MTNPLKDLVSISTESFRPRENSRSDVALFSFSAYDAGKRPEQVVEGSIKSNKTRVRNGDVLFAKLNPRIPRVWPIHYGKGTSPLVCSTEFVVLRPKDGVEIDPDYISYMLAAPQFLAPIQRLVSSSTKSHQRVKPAQIVEGSIPFRPIEEQCRIVARIQECFSRVEETERLQAVVMADAKAVAKAFLREIESSIETGAVPLDRILINTKNGQSPESKRPKHNCSVLTLAAVKNVVLDPGFRKGIELSDREQGTFRIKKGEVFVSRANTIDLVGLSSVVADEPEGLVTFPDLLIRLTPDINQVSPQFLALALRFPGVRRQIRDRAIGSSRSMVKISGARLKEVKIPLPPIEMQAELFDRYLRFSNRADEIRTQVNGDCQNLRTAILRQAFAGEL